MKENSWWLYKNKKGGKQTGVQINQVGLRREKVELFSGKEEERQSLEVRNKLGTKGSNEMGKRIGRVEASTLPNGGADSGVNSSSQKIRKR